VDGTLECDNSLIYESDPIRSAAPDTDEQIEQHPIATSCSSTSEDPRQFTEQIYDTSSLLSLAQKPSDRYPTTMETYQPGAMTTQRSESSSPDIPLGKKRRIEGDVPTRSAIAAYHSMLWAAMAGTPDEGRGIEGERERISPSLSVAPGICVVTPSGETYTSNGPVRQAIQSKTTPRRAGSASFLHKEEQDKQVINRLSQSIVDDIVLSRSETASVSLGIHDTSTRRVSNTQNTISPYYQNSVKTGGMEDLQVDERLMHVAKALPHPIPQSQYQSYTSDVRQQQPIAKPASLIPLAQVRDTGIKTGVVAEQTTSTLSLPGKPAHRLCRQRHSKLRDNQPHRSLYRPSAHAQQPQTAQYATPPQTRPQNPQIYPIQTPHSQYPSPHTQMTNPAPYIQPPYVPSYHGITNAQPFPTTSTYNPAHYPISHPYSYPPTTASSTRYHPDFNPAVRTGVQRYPQSQGANHANVQTGLGLGHSAVPTYRYSQWTGSGSSVGVPGGIKLDDLYQGFTILRD
jgi:hypothetical protein